MFPKISPRNGERPKLLFFVTEDWYFCSHRLPLAAAAKDAGCEVTALTRVRGHAREITDAGLRVIPIELDRHGRNPFRDLLLLWRVWRVYRREKPDIVHHVAIKPVLYGTLAARLAGVPRVVNALAGLGYLFLSRQLKARALRPFVETAFRLTLRSPRVRVIVQNPDDAGLLRERRMAPPGGIVLIRGSGVDTGVFRVTPPPQGVPVVMLASRMLWDKGVGEFVEAALLLADCEARFVLVGDTDEGNPAAVPRSQLEAWNGGPLEWWGHRRDMPATLAQANIVCLPSYREGLPKVLIEAASCGRPLVATDTPGCREIVRHEVNGLLVPARDAAALAAALRRLLGDPERSQAMGLRGREMVKREFSSEKVIADTLSLYESMLR